jgi:hypothetical protein
LIMEPDYWERGAGLGSRDLRADKERRCLLGPRYKFLIRACCAMQKAVKRSVTIPALIKKRSLDSVELGERAAKKRLVGLTVLLLAALAGALEIVVEGVACV